jgi:hypothetical protein
MRVRAVLLQRDQGRLSERPYGLVEHSPEQQLLNDAITPEQVAYAGH